MRFLIVGLGSMGKRRIRNLQELKADEIIGFDLREDRRKQAEELYGIETVENFDSAIARNPEVMIISTPPHRHLEYVKKAIERNLHFFTEVNTMSPNEIQIIIDSLKKSKVVGIPSSTLLFHPSVKRIKTILRSNEIGKPLVLNFHSGSYLPEWHPWEKLEEYYAYEKSTGGGRDEVAWEFGWILPLMGRPKNVTAFARKLGSYEAKIYDMYDILIEFENNAIGHVMVELFQRPMNRVCEIIGDKGTIRWEWDSRIVRVYNADNKEWKEYPEKIDHLGHTVEKPRPGFAISDNIGIIESYIEEMKNFIDIINGKKEPSYTFEDEKINLQLMYASEESSEKGIHVKL